MRVGIFGGSFNPPHIGHINSMLTVAKKTGLQQVRVIPTSQNPLKSPIEGASAEQRLEMVRLALSSYGPLFFVDDQEVKRGGVNYTIDTIKNLRKEISADDLYLIIGVDNFENFGSWKDYTEILKEVNLVVTTRPGHSIPDSQDELPEAIKPFVAEYDFNFVELTTNRSIQFINLEDVETSSTELRKSLRVNKSVEKFLPLAVENYIKEQELYRPIGDRIGDYEQFTRFCAQELFAKKAIQVMGYDLRSLEAPSEFTLVASGTSTRHAVSLGENIIRAVKEEYNIHPLSIEGVEEGRWVLLDYGSLIIHLFYDYVRQEYSIEKLWRDGKNMGIIEAPAPK